jgi:hypothetical protein
MDVNDHLHAPATKPLVKKRLRNISNNILDGHFYDDNTA